MSLVADLRAARALVATPGQWAQGSYAKDANGRAVQISANEACTFCVMGALDKTTGKGTLTNVGTDRFIAARDALLVGAQTPFNLPVWNDDKNRTHAEVLTAFDNAIFDAEMFA